MDDCGFIRVDGQPTGGSDRAQGFIPIGFDSSITDEQLIRILFSNTQVSTTARAGDVRVPFAGTCTVEACIFPLAVTTAGSTKFSSKLNGSGTDIASDTQTISALGPPGTFFTYSFPVDALDLIRWFVDPTGVMGSCSGYISWAVE